MSSSAPLAAALPPLCPVPECGHRSSSLRSLKTHLLLKHPSLNVCLFCVEKKGWSDEFASQAQYNKVRSQRKWTLCALS